MFQYQVMTEQQAMNERFQLLKEGIYDAVITASQDTMSSKGSPMMDMTVSVFDENGKQVDVRDFLVFTKPMMWKIIHFASSAGIMKEYEMRRMCSQVAINRRVQVHIGIDQGKEIPQDKLQGKPLGSKYPDKNKVIDYIKKEDQNQPEVKGTNFQDDDVPFL